jgi:hypothetical protein
MVPPGALWIGCAQSVDPPPLSLWSHQELISVATNPRTRQSRCRSGACVISILPSTEAVDGTAESALDRLRDPRRHWRSGVTKSSSLSPPTHAPGSRYRSGACVTSHQHIATAEGSRWQSRELWIGCAIRRSSATAGDVTKSSSLSPPTHAPESMPKWRLRHQHCITTEGSCWHRRGSSLDRLCAICRSATAALKSPKEPISVATNPRARADAEVVLA